VQFDAEEGHLQRFGGNDEGGAERSDTVKRAQGGRSKARSSRDTVQSDAKDAKHARQKSSEVHSSEVLAKHARFRDSTETVQFEASTESASEGGTTATGAEKAQSKDRSRDTVQMDAKHSWPRSGH
jgi:hypothetical protein